MKYGSKHEYVYFRLDALGLLNHSSSPAVQELDWYDDIAKIQRFYAHWTSDLIDPAENDDIVGNPLAIILHDEIISFAIPFSFHEGELEIGAVATIPAYQNQGYCKALISELAYRILKKGMIATLTTRKENVPMRAAALSIGMQQIEKLQ